MRKFIKAAALSILLLLAWVGAEAQFPPDGQYSPVAVPNIPRPAYRVPVTDPAFGTRITRITDAAAFGASDVRHGYSLRPAWNFDQTKILLDGINNPSIWILDGNTYAILRTIPRLLDLRWSSVDPNKIFGVSGNRFVSINATTAAQTTLHTFAGYSEVSIGKQKGNLSIGDRYVALIADNQAVIVYDVQTDTVIATRTFTQLGSSPSAFQWASMSQSGNYVVFAGGASASYDRNFNKISDLTPAHLPHGDMAYDTSGNEVYASICPPSMQRLSNGAKTSLLTSPECGHVSARNYKRPGWYYMNFAGAGRPLDVLAVKLDGSKTVERFTHHRSTQATYTAQTHSSVSPDGTKVMFASDWNGTSEVNSYVVDLPGAPPANTPPTVSLTAPANGATVSGNTVVTATAADPGGDVVGVQFKLDGGNLGSEDFIAPYSVTWNTGASSQGAHTLTAVARDGGGLLTTSAAVGVTVSNAVAPANVKYSLPLRTAQVGAIEPTVGPSAVLRLCGGTPPATASEHDGGIELVEMRLPPDWATTAVAAIIQKLGPWLGTVKFAGQPTHFRIYSADGTPHIQGSVTDGSGGGVITLADMALLPGRTIRISTFQIAAGNAGLLAPSAPNRLLFSTAVQNASVDRVQAIVGPNALLKLITGAAPALIDSADPGSVVAAMTLPTVYLSPASGGIAQQLGSWADPSADLTGVPGHAVFFDSTGAIRHILVSVSGTGGGGVLQLSNPNVVAGNNVPVTGFSIRAANQ